MNNVQETGILKSLAWRRWLAGLIIVFGLIVGCQATDAAVEGPATNGEWEPVIQEFDGVAMAQVPAGCFTMGDPEIVGAQPAHEVCLTESYWIDVTEVSNAQFERLGGEAGREITFADQILSAAEFPRTSVTWEEADAFCRQRGGFLPTEAEWEFAARGPESWTYPWGDAFEPTHLNHCNQGCPIGAASQGPLYATDDGYATAAAVDSMALGASWVGALHMAGNAAEWVADWYSADYYAQAPAEDPAGPDSGLHRVVKSTPWSWYLDPELHSQSASRWDFVPDGGPNAFSGTTGFRCARAGG